MVAYTSSPVFDPDQLTYTIATSPYSGNFELIVDTTLKVIVLKVYGNLTTDGVTVKCVYSKLKEIWRTDATLIKFPFPMGPITDEQFEMVNGWNWEKTFTSGTSSATTPELLRTGGWSVVNTNGQITEMWASIITLGTLGSTDQVYYQQVDGSASADILLTGPVNQALQILSDPNGDGNYADGYDRRSFFKIFAREYQKIYALSKLSDIGVTQLTYQAYRFPLTNNADIKITADDTAVSANSPYTQIKVRYFDQNFSIPIDTPGTPRDYGIVIDVGTHSGVDGSTSAAGSVLTSAEGGIPTDATYTGGTLIIHEGADAGTYTISGTPTATQVTITGTFTNGGSNQSFTIQRASPVAATAEQIYTKVQYLLRQATDIDETDQSVTGKTADELLRFVGDTLGTLNSTNPNYAAGDGVVIVGFASADTNRLVFVDNTGTSRTYPYVAVLQINFGTNLQNDASAIYRVFFTSVPDGDFGTANAIIVNDNAGSPMSGNVSAQAFVQRTFNYDGNTQGSRTAGQDAPITAVALGLSTAQYVLATGTIQRSIANAITLTAALERNYANP